MIKRHADSETGLHTLYIINPGFRLDTVTRSTDMSITVPGAQVVLSTTNTSYNELRRQSTYV